MVFRFAADFRNYELTEILESTFECHISTLRHVEGMTPGLSRRSTRGPGPPPGGSSQMTASVITAERNQTTTLLLKLENRFRLNQENLKTNEKKYPDALKVITFSALPGRPTFNIVPLNNIQSDGSETIRHGVKLCGI